MNSIALTWYDIAEPSWAAAIEPFVQSVLVALNHDNWEVSLVLCGDSFIHELNKHYRGIDSPTDVLSFEQSDSYYDGTGQQHFVAGDIVISIDTLKKNAAEFSVTADEELKRLLIHGILHLSGMDHSDNSPQQEMLQLQERILDRYADMVVYQE